MVTRHLIRSAYGIPGSECEDCYMTMFCPCCTINQMIQTTTAYGLPTQDGGRMRNVNQFTTEAGNCTCGTCMYSLFCCPCAIGSTMEKAIGMNFWFGCCCVNMCTARNVVRYQYRLAGDDCCDDFCAPTCGAILTYYCPCFILCTFPYFLATIMKIISEAENRTQAAGVYGSKYLPPLATAPPPVVMGVEQTHNVVVVPTVIINNPNQA